MLLTICPICSAQFKVQPEQLNVRQGRVMCGRCRHVFNAFQSLSRVEDTGLIHNEGIPETVVARVPVSQLPTTVTAPESAMGPPADRLFLREEFPPSPAAFSASGDTPKPTRTRPPPAAAVFMESPAIYIPSDYNNAEEPIASQNGVRDVKLREPAIDLSSDDNPLLLPPPSREVAPIVGTSIMWRLGAIVLLTGLIMQAAFAFRSTLVSHYPQLRPTFGELCEFAGCSLSWGRDEAALKIEASELIEAPGKPGRILLTAILVNRGKTKQDLPSLELRLTDNANQVVVSRLLSPADYLGRAINKDEGLVPNTELYVNVDLKLELSNKPPASGYGLIVFYP